MGVRAHKHSLCCSMLQKSEDNCVESVLYFFLYTDFEDGT